MATIFQTLKTVYHWSGVLVLGNSGLLHVTFWTLTAILYNCSCHLLTLPMAISQRARPFWFFPACVFELSPSPIVLSISLLSSLLDKTTASVASYWGPAFPQSRRELWILGALNPTLPTFTSKLRRTHFFGTAVNCNVVACSNLSRYCM